jgi:excisionase family DNA binding protein
MVSPELVNRIAQEVVARVTPLLTGDGNPQSTKAAGITPRLLTVKEAALYLGRSVSAIYHLIGRREIPVIRRGRHVRLDRLEIDRWLEGDRV